jgi:hypothetical protein
MVRTANGQNVANRAKDAYRPRKVAETAIIWEMSDGAEHNLRLCPAHSTLGWNE